MTASNSTASDDAFDDEEELTRDSNVRLPSGLADRFRAEAERRGFDHGALLIAVLEETLADGSLEKYLHPAGVVGGVRFKKRAVTTSRRKGDGTDETTSAVAFTALDSDFEMFKQLRTELLARSVNHLLAAAIEAHYAAEGRNGAVPGAPDDAGRIG
ncbi:hypothetical protein [Nocardia transvalensis]|uniref:hypothetical protein n=1 Tax=Nocardia transvalensis TaxID=37333 RepID=UPI00189415F7|nr:hypothetical protein [Nocardia transvalensis]MBF6333639.1 hypothetical protein [Nocardia transvalensis]